MIEFHTTDVKFCAILNNDIYIVVNALADKIVGRNIEVELR